MSSDTYINRNYDAEEFDWDGHDSTVQAQGDVDRVEKLIRTALQATAPVEDSWLRPSKVDNDRARITYNIPYALTKEQKEHASELVGDIRTLTFNASGYHDHPLSHVVTEISEDLVVRKFGNEPFVSVYGNQSRHRRMGHVGAVTVSNRHVPHDWFRNRGQEESVTDIAEFLQGRNHLKYRLFLDTHGAYYSSLEDIARWLGGNPEAEYHAIVHRHGQSHGRLNKGELEYSVDDSGMVIQINPSTGFKYTHKTMEPLFHADSCRVFGGKVGLTWDINRLAGDTYHIKFVLCDPRGCAKLTDPWELIKSKREVTIRGDVTVYRILGMEWYVYSSSGGNVVLHDVDLFDRLRRAVAGKARTIRDRTELMALCRRLSNKNDIISVHQGFFHNIDPDLFTDYVSAAFYCDVDHELEVAIKYHRENKAAVDALNKYYTQGIVPPDYTNLAKVGKAVAAPFTTLAGMLHKTTVGARYSIMTGEPVAEWGDLPADESGDRKALILSLNQDAEKMALSLRKGPPVPTSKYLPLAAARERR